MISCPKCGKENQDHYKFCLGCGNELPRDGHGARPFQPTPPAGVQSPAAAARPPAASAASAGGPAPFGAPPGPAPFGGAPPGPSPFGAPPGPAPAAGLGTAGPFGGAPIPSSLGAPPGPAPAPFGGAPFGPAPMAAPAPKAAAATCPQCGMPNTRGARFCLTCGNDLSGGVPSVAPAAAPVAAAPAMAPAAPAPAPFAAPPAPSPAPVAGARPSAGRLVLIRPDGTEGGTFQLNEGNTVVGRETGGLFAGDSYLSPRHATFTVNGQSVNVRDENSLNGVYVRIERQAPVEIRDGDTFRIGQEILRYDAYKPVAPEADGTEKQGAQVEGLVGRIALVIGRDTYGNSFPIPVTGLFLGRERGDILFPEDGYVSGLHCQLAIEGGKLMLTDVGSSNGSYVRVRGERTVHNGDLLLVGQQLFRLTF